LREFSNKKNLTKNPRNTFSDALLKSRFQNFAAGAAKKNHAARSSLKPRVLIDQLMLGQTFWEVDCFTGVAVWIVISAYSARGYQSYLLETGREPPTIMP